MAPAADRQQRIAHLAIHGWEPYKAPGRVGVYNAQVGVGFVRLVGPTEFDPLGQRVGEVCRVSPDPHTWTVFAAEWDEVGDDVLDAIDERLSAT